MSLAEGIFICREALVKEREAYMKSARNPETFLPLQVPFTYILFTLLDGDKHGYAIWQEVNTITNKSMSIPPTSLYRSIDTMCNSGLIEQVGEGERRKVYRITSLGSSVLESELKRMESLLVLFNSKIKIRP